MRKKKILCCVILGEGRGVWSMEEIINFGRNEMTAGSIVCMPRPSLPFHPISVTSWKATDMTRAPHLLHFPHSVEKSETLLALRCLPYGPTANLDDNYEKTNLTKRLRLITFENRSKLLTIIPHR